MWEVYIPGAVVAVLLLLAFIKSNLYICPPNELLIFSGKKRKLEDGTVVGFRIIKGGRGFKWPILESVYKISLGTMQVEIELKDALGKGLIPLNVHGIANIKIAGSEKEGMFNSVERFLGKPKDEIARIAKQTLEGSMRGVLATLTPEEANTGRLDFAKKVMEESNEDFSRLGLVIDTFKVQSVTDDRRYLEAIGRKRNAEVQKEARIAEAVAEAEARKVSAEAKKEGAVAEAKAEEDIVEAKNELRVRTAELDAEGREAEEKAKVDGEISRIEREIDLQEKRILRNEKRLQADVVLPAKAQKEADELQAQGRAAKITEDGKATAEAIGLMRKEWEKGDTKDLFLIQLLPEIIDKITNVISDNLAIEKLTIVDGGKGDGLPSHLRGLTGSVVSVFEEVKNATGLDIPQLLDANKKKNGADLKKELD